MLHEYETTLILRSDLDAAEATGTIERFESSLGENDATLLVRDDWGKRKMAYPIKKSSKGHYVLFSFLSQAHQIEELERRLRLAERGIRFLTVRVADSVDVPARMAEAEEQRKKLAEEAERRAEQEALEAAKAAAEAEARAEAAAAAAAEAEARAAVEAAAAAEAEAYQATAEAAEEAAPAEAAEEAAPAEAAEEAAPEDAEAAAETTDSEG